MHLTARRFRCWRRHRQKFAGMGAGRTLQQATTSTNFNSLRHRATQQTKTRSIHLSHLARGFFSLPAFLFVPSAGLDPITWRLLDELILELCDSLG